ncbi:RING finger protein nhl-1 isoform X6 [Drosophila grimshawi]|uniref:RING finger protein nhl-1 isoform X6 n=1 Tax=Drosophila grimshawi TaxID=7222 RepID=UPI0013EF1390|nr:RING finger protein nhl-1 isoform X6 [Drosophila grimshawi]XP_032591107.1 RING finger protein nhl-1 isoform X6 [Drosophila grimshawi]
MEQFEQLLTCCVCLDRYRIPKLLPCQHSFCMEPCMEGLVDYVRRQVKCPECRAEHRIPYNGVQAFPTNVTLQRFLELHIEITGELPDPTSGQIMERCGVCSEKAYLSHCAHCEKKICEDCKSAHMDILRREITRFNSQIRRSLHRLQDSLAIIEKNTTSLQTNAISVTDEIDEIYRRITKAIKDRSDGLKGEIDRYLAVELRNLTTLKENLDLEIANIGSNCDIVDKYMNETVEWDDCELMDTKEIFMKTVEFLRHFEYENNDYSRRVRFLVSIDPNQLVMNLATFGDLNIAPHSTPGSSVSSSHLAPPSALQPGLMRSKSDHRLATQFRQQEERSGYNDEPVLGGRKFGERPQRTNNNSDRYGDNRYGRSEYDYDNDYENEPASRAGKSSRFRSRFVRSHQNEDSDSEQQQQQRQQEIDKRKDRVLDSEDVSRGQLSGIIRLSDCSRVVQRLADIGKEKKEKKSDAAVAAQAAVQAAIQTQKAAMQRQQQKSQQTAAAAADEDELARQKRKSGAASSTAAPSGESSSEQRPGADRVAALKRGGQGASTEESDGSSSNQATTASSSSKPAVSAQVAAVKKTQRSGSSDSSASTESSASSAAAAAASSAQATPSSSSNAQPKAATTARYSTARESSTAVPTATPEKKPFVSRFLPQHSNPSSANGAAEKKKPESESSSEEETSSESESESEPETKPKTIATSSSIAAKSMPSSAASSTTAATTSGSSSYRDRLEARRASRDDTAATTRSTYATPNSSSSGYSSSTRTRAVPAPHHLSETEDRYGSGTGSSSALPLSIPYISRPYRDRYRKRLADVSRQIK